MRIIAAVAVILVLPFLQGCSARLARQEEAQFRKELALKDEAWIAARLRLKSMCSPGPTSVEDYKQKAQLRLTGTDPFGGCDFRLMKLTNSPFTDDWEWLWLPAHTVIVKLHEEEARKKFPLKIYEELMLAVAYHLAKAIDSQEITPQEHRLLFNYAWSWMINKTKDEAILLRENTIKAEEQDAKVMEVLRTVGLALAAGLQGYGQAYARAYRPPTNCFGTKIGYSISVTCY